MGTITTTNTTLHPQDGWVEVNSATVANFMRCSYLPSHIPVWIAFGSSAPSLNGTAGSGTVTFSTGVPTTGQTVTIGTETYTFLAARTGPFTVAIGGTNLITATNFTAAVQSDSALVSAADASGVVTVTSKVKNIGGNYALTETASNVAVVSMTGATTANSGFRLPCEGSHFDGAVTGNMYARTSSNANAEVIISVFSN